jgi:hypothetical protein
MRHAGPEALDALADLIATVRAHGVKETRPGVFYRKGRAWLHFHEDRQGLFADVRAGDEWQRFRVSEPEERVALVAFLECSP